MPEIGTLKELIRRVLRRFGSVVISPARSEDALRDLSDRERQVVASVLPYTMTTVERLATLINAINFVERYHLEGAVAECGVWRGGSMMAVAHMLVAQGNTSRELYLYDTFEGMSEPTDRDVSIDGESASTQMSAYKLSSDRWRFASLEDVKSNLYSTGYPPEKIHFVKGRIEDTIPAAVPSRLALLRLDTDWHVSTRHELTHLYPLLVEHAVLIVDDYGRWKGARQAVDEYFSAVEEPIFFHRIDYTGRIAIRPSAHPKKPPPRIVTESHLKISA